MITWAYPLLNKTPLLNEILPNINTEEGDKEEEMVRDAGRIDADKFNLREARHSTKADLKNLRKQDKLTTNGVFI